MAPLADKSRIVVSTIAAARFLVMAVPNVWFRDVLFSSDFTHARGHEFFCQPPTPRETGSQHLRRSPRHGDTRQQFNAVRCCTVTDQAAHLTAGIPAFGRRFFCLQIAISLDRGS